MQCLTLAEAISHGPTTAVIYSQSRFDNIEADSGKLTIMATDFSTKLKMPFDEALQGLRTNLQRVGFTAISTIDLQDILKRRFNIGFRKYRILAAYNPKIAYKLISLESHLGAILPCNIVIQEHENGEVEISAINALLTIDNAESTPQIAEIAREVSNRLREAVDGLHAIENKTSNSTAEPWLFRPHGKLSRNSIKARWNNNILG